MLAPLVCQSLSHLTLSQMRLEDSSIWSENLADCVYQSTSTTHPLLSKNRCDAPNNLLHPRDAASTSQTVSSQPLKQFCNP